MDVAAAFDLTKNWTPLPTEKIESHSVNRAIPFSSHEEQVDILTIDAEDTDIQFIELVTLEMNIKAKDISEGVMFHILKLTNPDGIESFIFKRYYFFREIYYSIKEDKIIFIINSFVGSSVVSGDWKLSIKQFDNSTIEEITDWKLIIRGH